MTRLNQRPSLPRGRACQGSDMACQSLSLPLTLGHPRSVSGKLGRDPLGLCPWLAGCGVCLGGAVRMWDLGTAGNWWKGRMGPDRICLQSLALPSSRCSRAHCSAVLPVTPALRRSTVPCSHRWLAQGAPTHLQGESYQRTGNPGLCVPRSLDAFKLKLLL